MATPVYMLYLAKSATEAWYQLSKAEQDSLFSKSMEINTRVGATYHLACNSRWADEEISGWGVIEYPSMEAYQKKVEELEALEWWRYFSGKTILGTKMAM